MADPRQSLASAAESSRAAFSDRLRNRVPLTVNLKIWSDVLNTEGSVERGGVTKQSQSFDSCTWGNLETEAKSLTWDVVMADVYQHQLPSDWIGVNYVWLMATSLKSWKTAFIFENEAPSLRSRSSRFLCKDVQPRCFSNSHRGSEAWQEASVLHGISRYSKDVDTAGERCCRSELH